MDYKQDRELEIAKAKPAQTNLMIGRTEIPRWIGQEFDVWKKELEKWNENDKSTDEAKYCNVMESLKKNDKIKDYVITTLAEKTKKDSKVTAILKVMAEKYEKKMKSCVQMRATIIQYINKKKKEEMDYIQDRELEIAKAKSAQTNLMIERTEIPR